MNWWPRNQDNVLSERATAAERRLKAIKQVSSYEIKNIRSVESNKFKRLTLKSYNYY